MDSFIYEIEYREVLQYPHTYAMPRAPILALVLNGVRGGRRLNTCLVLRVEPNGLVTE